MSSRADPRSLPSLVPRLTGLARHANTRIVLAFWLLGLINNVLYVIILSAAQDLVGTLPKGIVLLADVVPSFVTKLVAPYFIHAIPYPVRVAVFIALSFCGMLLIASAPSSGSVGTKLLGVVLASLSSGGGELSFLGLTHHYGAVSLAGWGSGTGAAGLVGAGLYVVMTDWWHLGVSRSLMMSAFLPAIMLVGFFVVLPPRGEYKPVRGDEVEQHREEYQEEEEEDMQHLDSLRSKVARTKSLVLPYMLPLFVVYLAEYIINQGVSPTLLFAPSASPFRDLRDFYPFYGFLYQLGVFLSRSSTPFVRLHRLYPPALLQVANLVLLTLHALFDFLPNVYVVFFLVFWEGLLGGAVYVNCFAEIMDSVAPKDREFSLGAATVSDSAGICVAGLVSVFLETGLCRYQVAHGRDWCRRIEAAH